MKALALVYCGYCNAVHASGKVLGKLSPANVFTKW